MPALFLPDGWVRPGLLPWVGIAILAGAVVVGWVRRRGGRVRIFSLLAAVLAAVAAVGPVTGFRPERPAAPELELTLVVDVSRSMGVGTVSRLEAGRAAAHRLLADLPGARVALVAFGSSAHVLLPPTEDGTVVSAYLDALTPGLLSTPGTPWSAVLAGVALADSSAGVAGRPAPGSRRRLVLLLSDGEWALDGSDPEETPDLHRDGTSVPPVYVLWTDRPAVGAPAGGGRDAVSRVSRTLPDRLVLRRGGRVTPVSDGEALGQLRRELLQRADPGVGRRAGGGPGTPVDGAPLLAGAAAFLLVAGLLRWRTP